MQQETDGTADQHDDADYGKDLVRTAVPGTERQEAGDQSDAQQAQRDCLPDLLIVLQEEQFDAGAQNPQTKQPQAGACKTTGFDALSS